MTDTHSDDEQRRQKQYDFLADTTPGLDNEDNPDDVYTHLRQARRERHLRHPNRTEES